MEMSCYCCYSGSNKQVTSRKSNQVDMDQLNCALHELGMLSSVTNSRKEYLQEKSRRIHWHKAAPLQEPPKYQVEANTSGYCIRRLLGYWDIKPDGSGPGLAVRSEDLPSSLAAVEDCETRCMYKYSEENLDSQSSTNRVSKMRSGHRNSSYRFQKPYEVPWRRIVEERCRVFGGNLNQDSDSSRDSGLGNRSNPGSPERVHRETSAGSASSLSRSRSLDDLVGSVSVPPEPCVQEMENMSQKMEGLQILEKLVK